MTDTTPADEREAFEAYWRKRQLATHDYTDRECPDHWGDAFKPYAWSAWQARAASQPSLQAELDDQTKWAGHYARRASDLFDALLALEQAYSNPHSPQHRAACLAEAKTVLASFDARPSAASQPAQGPICIHGNAGACVKCDASIKAAQDEDAQSCQPAQDDPDRMTPREHAAALARIRALIDRLDDKPAQEPVAHYECSGCGRVTNDPAGDLSDIRAKGYISCCPDRKMIAAPPADTARQDRIDAALDAVRAMIDPLHPPGVPGSYARGHYNGIVDALQIFRAAEVRKG